MKTFKIFKVLNAALGEVSPLSHEVLYYILNNFNYNKTIRKEIPRIDIVIKLKLWDAENDTQRKLKKKLDDITKCTNELEEKGFLKKDLIYDTSTNKRKTFYSVGDKFIIETEQKNVQFEQETEHNNVQFEQETEQKRGVYKRSKEIKKIKQYNNTEDSKELQHACSASNSDNELPTF